jgi:hypothetical protein
MRPVAGHAMSGRPIGITIFGPTAAAVRVEAPHDLLHSRETCSLVERHDRFTALEQREVDGSIVAKPGTQVVEEQDTEAAALVSGIDADGADAGNAEHRGATISDGNIAKAETRVR